MYFFQELQTTLYSVIQECSDYNDRLRLQLNADLNSRFLPMIAEATSDAIQISLVTQNFAISAQLLHMLFTLSISEPRLFLKHLRRLVYSCLFVRDMETAYDVLDTTVTLYPSDGSGVPLTFEIVDILSDCFTALGTEQVQTSLVTSAHSSLTLAASYADVRAQLNNVSAHTASVCMRQQAILLTHLGYCLLYVPSADIQPLATLEKALQCWRNLQLCLDDVPLLVTALRHLAEARVSSEQNADIMNLCDELVPLHSLRSHGLGHLVPETLTAIGNIAFNYNRERQAVFYFEQAIALYRKEPPTEENREALRKLLRCLGVASYNIEDFNRAAWAYTECLWLLEPNGGDGARALSIQRSCQLADCYASLGFTYSRLRQFDAMMKYYERALELQHALTPDDLELIETNIGSLYHVRAALCESNGDESGAKRYYGLAETSFQRALTYSWKSFPYINYGYYLLCRGRYNEAANSLQQGHLNGLQDMDTVEFDHTEDAILLPELRRELEGREDIRAPASVLALYLRARALAAQGARLEAAQVVAQLQSLVETCRFEAHFTDGFGVQHMAALSYSLLGYTYEALQAPLEAARAFSQALDKFPEYPAASDNLLRLTTQPVSE